MTIPSEILEIIQVGLSQMEQHPQHQFDWRIRRIIYKKLNSEYPLIGYNVHNWLAILTAEHVLSIFLENILDDSLPKTLIDCAKKVVNGSANPESADVRDLIDYGYHATGIDCLEWRGIIAYNAEYSGNAAYKALLETTGVHNLLENTEGLISNKSIQVFHMPKNLTSDGVMDSDIAHLAAFSDTASSAYMAYACSRDSRIVDEEKSKEFWNWWGTIGIYQAWKKALETAR